MVSWARYLSLTITACLLLGFLAEGLQHGLPEERLSHAPRLITKHREKRGWFRRGLGRSLGRRIRRCWIFCRRRPRAPSPAPPPPPAPVDNDDPYFTQCPSNIHKTIPKRQTSVAVTWDEPKAADKSSKISSIEQPAGGTRNGGSFSRTKVITYLALDEFSNTAKCQFTVYIKLITCGRPFFLTNGKVECPSWPADVIWGHSCTWSCNDGYELKHTCMATQECDQDGQFQNGGICTCIKKQCGDVNLKLEANMLLDFCTDEDKYQSACSVKCANGHGPLDKTRLLTCNSIQEWDGYLDPCTELPDKEPPYFTFCPVDMQITIPEGEQMVSVTWAEPEAIDSDSGLDRIEQTQGPANGSKFDKDSKIIYHAFDMQTNTAECSFYIFVTLITCRMPTAPVNGYIECAVNTSGLVIWGDMCTWSCDDGYELSGTKQQACSQDGEFSDGGMVQCSKTQCPDVNDEILDHMVLNTCTDGNNFESVCVFTCEEGFGPLAKSRELVCGADRMWSGTIEACRDIEPPHIQNCPGSITVFTERGKDYGIATWTEPTAVDRQGAANIQLTVGLPPGSEFSTEPINLHHIVYSAIDGETNEAEQCQFNVQVIDRTCEPFRDGEKMTTACDGSSWGSSCDLTCESGYPLNGSSTVYCEEVADGTSLEWDVGLYYPFCTIFACADLHTPDNGAISCSNWAHGRYCKISCNIDFDTPRSTLSEWTCDATTGQWNQNNQPPNCTPRRNPGASYQRSSLFYFTGDCTDEATQTQIRENFIAVIKQSQYSAICTESDECSVDNVDVTCGTLTRKKREIRKARSIFTHKVGINFHFKINIRYPDNFTRDDADEVFNTMDNLFFQMSDLFQQDVSSGAMDLSIPGLETEVDPDSFIYNWSELECDYGMTPNDASFSCSMCPQGTMYNGDIDDCADCPVGTHQDEAGQLQCKTCPENMSTVSTGSIYIDQCKALCDMGYISTTGLEPCALCPIGKYQDQSGSTECTECPSGTTTLSTGSTDVLLCLDKDEIDNYYFCNKSACNGGICLFNSDGTTHCVCHDGYTGDACEIPPDPCEDIVCDNGGSCVSINSEYICHCQLGYTGQYCRDIAQNGGFSVWTLWSECSVTCGSGNMSRSRECNSPAPGLNGWPCLGESTEMEACVLEECPACPPLELPESYESECTIPDTSQHSCDIRCKDGYANVHNRFQRIKCGPLTNFQWSFRIGNLNRNLPSCAQSAMPKTMSVTTTLENSEIPCDSDVSLENVQSFVSENSNCSTMPNCETKLHTECSKIDIKRNVRDLSSKKTVIYIVGTLPNLNIFPNGLFDLDIAVQAEEIYVALASDMVNLVESLSEAAASGELVVIADGVKYKVNYDAIADVECPVGTILLEGVCVICPVGMYQTDVQCELCNVGYYQDREGMASCIQCPGGHTTLEEGAIHSSECYNVSAVDDIDYMAPTTSTTIYSGENKMSTSGQHKEDQPEEDGNNYNNNEVPMDNDGNNGKDGNRTGGTTTWAPDDTRKQLRKTPEFLYPTIGAVVGVVLILVVIIVVVMVLKKKKTKPRDCKNGKNCQIKVEPCEYGTVTKEANVNNGYVGIGANGDRSLTFASDTSTNIPSNRRASAGSISMSIVSRSSSSVGGSADDFNPCPPVE